VGGGGSNGGVVGDDWAFIEHSVTDGNDLVHAAAAAAAAADNSWDAG